MHEKFQENRTILSNEFPKTGFSFKMLKVKIDSFPLKGFYIFRNRPVLQILNFHGRLLFTLALLFHETFKDTKFIPIKEYATSTSF